ncbi:MAG: thiopurine S-methyltransferase [Gammaproteobacteria bacterium]|nr:thiopurine S-methyltransferase [Gammaproteobacteria bacterium]
MEPDFWRERWQQNQIGFHQGEVNPYLREHWAGLGIAAPARVLVPLCGKSLDLVWLRQQGYQVEGVELSEVAVQAFFEEQAMPARQSTQGAFQVWEADGLRLWCGDFFKLDSTRLGPVDAVYDRAALIALPEEMRRHYVRHLQTLIGPVPHLLITLDYPQSQMNGPPFAVGQAEVEALFSDRFDGTHAPLCHDVLRDNAHLQSRGVERLHECVYQLQVPKK